MSVSNLRAVDHEQRRPIRVEDTTEPYEQTFDEQDVSRRVVNRKGRHLNVDEVLARSLPKLTDKGRNSGGEKNLAGF